MKMGVGFGYWKINPKQSTDVPGWEVDIQPIVDFVVHHVEV
jgi:hypothetical protein